MAEATEDNPDAGHVFIAITVDDQRKTKAETRARSVSIYPSVVKQKGTGKRPKANHEQEVALRHNLKKGTEAKRPSHSPIKLKPRPRYLVRRFFNATSEAMRMGKEEGGNVFREVMYFNGLSKEDQLRVLDALEKDPRTLIALVNIGWAPESFSSLDPEVQKRLLRIAKGNEKLTRRLNLGAAYAKADPNVRALMIDCLDSDELKAAFAFQLGLNFADLGDEAFNGANRLILSDERRMVMFAYGVGAASPNFSEDTVQKLLSLAASNKVFARNFGRSFIQTLREQSRSAPPTPQTSPAFILNNARGELPDAISEEMARDPTGLPAIAASLSGNDEPTSKLALQLSNNFKSYRGSRREALIQSLAANPSLEQAFCSSLYGLGIDPIQELKDDELEALLQSSPTFATCMGVREERRLASSTESKGAS